LAKSQHSYIKRQKELKRLKKAEEKRKRRLQKKHGGGEEPTQESEGPEKAG